MSNILSSRLYDQNTFYQAFERDLKNSRRSVLIESPFITTKRINRLMPILRSLSRKGIRIVVNTRSPLEHGPEHVIQVSKAITTMHSIGVRILYTGKLHRKLAIIDNQILWEGSLNILSQSDSCEIMRRIVSHDLAIQMARYTGVATFTD